MRKEIYRDKRRIDYLIDNYSFFEGKYELMSHWTKYLCVIICGYLEKSIQRTLKEYSKNKSHKTIARYVNINLDRFQNAKCNKIIHLIELYNLKWSDDVKQFIKGEIKDSIDGMVNTRHQIAHGETITLTPGNLRKYYSNINKFLDYLWVLINE